MLTYKWGGAEQYRVYIHIYFKKKQHAGNVCDAHSAFGFRLNDCCIGSVTRTPDRQTTDSRQAASLQRHAGSLEGWGRDFYNKQVQHPLIFRLTKVKFSPRHSAKFCFTPIIIHIIIIITFFHHREKQQKHTIVFTFKVFFPVRGRRW